MNLYRSLFLAAIFTVCLFGVPTPSVAQTSDTPTITAVPQPQIQSPRYPPVKYPPGCQGDVPCPVTSGAGVINVLDCAGPDIGAKINQCIQTYGAKGTFYIPDGTYTFSTPIVIAQTTVQQSLAIDCSSRDVKLDFTGSGDAITISSNTLDQQVAISNCSLYGTAAASGSNGIFLHDTQNALLSNLFIIGFPNANILGIGSIGSRIESCDILGASVNLELQDDIANFTGSTGNRMHLGTLQYGRLTNFWDQGISAPNSGNSGDILDGVTMEERPPAPNAIIEGTWNDAIINSYVECLYDGNSSNYFNVIVGNRPGSGYGTQTTQTASMFHFANNFVGTCQPGPGDLSATLDIINSIGLDVSGIRDAGYEVYGFVFDSAGTNTKATIGPSNIGWGNGLYLNPPPDAVLYQDLGQPLAPSEWQSDANGFHFNTLNAQTLNATQTYQFNGAPVTVNRSVIHASYVGSPMPPNTPFGWYVNDATTSVAVPSGCTNSVASAFSAPTAAVTLNIMSCSSAGFTKCSVVGTISFAAGSGSGTFSCPAAFSLQPNYGLAISSPVNGDNTFGNLAIALYGAHN
jgi:hypothetical protein